MASIKLFGTFEKDMAGEQVGGMICVGSIDEDHLVLCFDFEGQDAEGNDVYHSLKIRSFQEVDALRRYCEMVLEHHEKGVLK
jgi:hypothetical protein